MPGTAARQAPPLAIGSDAQVLALSSRPLSMVPGRDIPARRRRQNVRAARLTGQVGSTHARLLALPNEWNAPDASRRPQQSTSRWHATGDPQASEKRLAALERNGPWTADNVEAIVRSEAIAPLAQLQRCSPSRSIPAPYAPAPAHLPHEHVAGPPL
jgi:hypothetical protein